MNMCFNSQCKIWILTQIAGIDNTCTFIRYCFCKARVIRPLFWNHKITETCSNDTSDTDLQDKIEI